MRYLETGSTDPAYNLAFEEIVLQNRRDADYLLLWQNDGAVIIGKNQNTDEEIDRQYVQAHHLRVVRRSTGGGAVYHDLGNLNYSFITDAGDPEKISAQRFTLPVVAALRGLGLQAEASGRNDILVNGLKVSGTAERLLDGRILHHGTLLFDSDPTVMERALRPAPEKFQSKGIKSVRSRVGNIRDALPVDMDLPAFWAYLKQSLARNGLEETSLTPEELAAVTRCRTEKYDTWEWNYGHSPRCDVRCKKKWPDGILDIQAKLRNGRIDVIRFYGDFLSRSPLTELTDALCGCPFSRADVARILERFSMRDLLGGITAQQVLDTLFDA